MRIRLLTLALLVLALAATGCGSDSGDAQTTRPGGGNPESGTQAVGGFPGAGSPNAPDVTTTPGPPPKQSGGKPGGGSSATCVGC